MSAFLGSCSYLQHQGGALVCDALGQRKSVSRRCLLEAFMSAFLECSCFTTDGTRADVAEVGLASALDVTTAMLRSRLRQGSRCELLDPRRRQSSVVDAGRGRAMANRDEGLRHGEERDRTSRQGLSQNGLSQNGLSQNGYGKNTTLARTLLL